MKGNIHILSLYDVILLIPNPPVLSRLTLHNFKSSILLYWYTTNAHGQCGQVLTDHIFFRVGHLSIYKIFWYHLPFFIVKYKIYSEVALCHVGSAFMSFSFSYSAWVVYDAPIVDLIAMNCHRMQDLPSNKNSNHSLWYDEEFCGMWRQWLYFFIVVQNA